jgi:hypothetical protein
MKMAYHGILVQNSVQAMNIDALNRSVTSAIDIDNGNCLSLTGLSTNNGEREVWTAATPTSGTLTDLWMAYEPEVVLTVSGDKQYKGINPDIRDFYNIAGDVFSAFKPQKGDILLLTGDALGGTKGTNTYVIATNGSVKLTWGASAISGLSLKLLETTYISIADGSIGTQRTTAYRFVVEATA